MLRVVVIEPGFPAEIREVNHDLKSLQAFTEEYIQYVPFIGGSGQ